MTRGLILLLALALLAAAPPPPKPRRIMSINLCNDLMLMMLVPKTRIASVTFLAHDAAAALLPGRDAGIAINHAAAEEILQQRPGLILGSAWTSPAARRLARMVGAPVVEMESPRSFAEIRDYVRHMGRVVGEPRRAEALVRDMDLALARLDATRPARRLRVVAWSGAGTVPGRGTLTDAIISAAGGDNIGAFYRDGRFSSFGLEQLVLARPDAVMQGVAGYDQPSLQQQRARHPLVDRLFAGRQIAYPEAAYTCGLPQSAGAAAELRAALARVAARS